MIISTTVVFAEGNYGQNVFEWGKNQLWYIALLAIIIFAIKFFAKKMWVQLGGLVVLGSIVLVIVDGPEKLKSLGLTLWNIVIGG